MDEARDGLRFEFVPPEAVTDAWDVVSHGVDRIREHGAHWRLEDVYLMLRTGQAHLHVAFEGPDYKGFVITQQHAAPDGMVLHVWGAYSVPKASVLEQGREQIDDWARNIKARRVTFHSPRKGWERVGKRLGFEPSMVIYERKV